MTSSAPSELTSSERARLAVSFRGGCEVMRSASFLEYLSLGLIDPFGGFGYVLDDDDLRRGDCSCATPIPDDVYEDPSSYAMVASARYVTWTYS